MPIIMDLTVILFGKKSNGVNTNNIPKKVRLYHKGSCRFLLKDLKKPLSGDYDSSFVFDRPSDWRLWLTQCPSDPPASSSHRLGREIWPEISNL